MAFAAILLVNVSCSRDRKVTQPKGAYENRIIIANEGGFSTPTASISFTKEDLSSQENNIFQLIIILQYWVMYYNLLVFFGIVIFSL